MSPFNPNQDRLFIPPRIEHFCPVQHCGRRCGAGTCICPPCGPGCEHCAKRREIGRRVARQPIELLDLPVRQPRLPGTSTRRSNPKP